jgi:hypothetical protein
MLVRMLESLRALRIHLPPYAYVYVNFCVLTNLNVLSDQTILKYQNTLFKNTCLEI